MSSIKKVFFIPILYCLSVCELKAQETSTLSEKIIDENETYLPNLFIRVNPIWTEWVFYNPIFLQFGSFPYNFDSVDRLAIGSSADAMLFIRKWITLRASLNTIYSKKLLDGYYVNFNSPEYPNTTTNKTLGYFSADAGIGYHLIDTLFQKSKKIYSGTGNSADYDYQKSLALQKKLIRRIIELRTGVYYYHRSLVDWMDGSIHNNSSASTMGVISSDGVQWGGAKNYDTLPIFLGAGYTTMYVPCGYIGLDFIRQMDRTNKADCDTYKIKGKRNLLNLFADLIIGSPFIAPYKGTDGTKHDVGGPGAIGYERNYVGYRAGVEYSTGKRRAFNVKFMYIKKPGLKLFAKENSIFELSLGVCFNRLVMKHALRKKFGS